MGVGNMAKPKKLNEDKVNYCYYCDKPIETLKDHVIKQVPLAVNGSVKYFNRQLHIDCMLKYNEQLEDKELKAVENSEWDKVYQYFKNEILQMDTASLSREDTKSHLAQRLLGLRVGRYFPNGNNTRILPKGYDFNTILIAMKVVNPKIQVYLSTANFANFKHRIDGCMRFIVSEIPDVAKRIASQQKANAKLDEEVVKTPVFDYKEALKKQKQEEVNKGIADDVSSLLGGSL